MSIKKIYIRLIQWFPFLLFILLISAETLVPFAVIYAVSAFILAGQMWLSPNKTYTKIIFSVIYLVIMIAQQVFITSFVFSGNEFWGQFMLKKFVAIFFIFAPYFVSYLNYLYTLQHQLSLKDASSISFEMIKKIHERGIVFKTNVRKGTSSLSKENLNEIVKDIPRHSYTNYLNKNTLTNQYFEECEKSLDDKHLYIIISSTGSPASELISLFTNKAYNHVSLSFDRELKTIISYNGGENVAPPGLNREQLVFFNKKDDASIMVYKIPTPREKKQAVIDKIREINEVGSAYNLIGLVTKFSVRPNIMFCSQFVYEILKFAEIEYFHNTSTKIKPTDFVENDYYRKLQFCYEIKFNAL
ncbi:hypothetical protein ERJ70_13960 [Sediminibacillus dalangtanensis]|uniref:Permuted papain-like amidase enzyme, YaeF/YiiX, C92 family n=1 Tax=Sediminibacillus dalangtanensis TaxID=2729421 RepID=A0ABX7VXH5_9BACI|nr:hypothetical protein [Sediminibacillus dalangtanensis]QTN00306.1 hypothetical protein ERJ70_13960 [Sediminibacillus dalangtanensis]